MKKVIAILLILTLCMTLNIVSAGAVRSPEYDEPTVLPEPYQNDIVFNNGTTTCGITYGTPSVFYQPLPVDDPDIWLSLDADMDDYGLNSKGNEQYYTNLPGGACVFYISDGVRRTEEIYYDHNGGIIINLTGETNEQGYDCVYVDRLDAVPTETIGIDGGYYIVFKGDNNQIRQRNRLTYEFGNYVIHGIMMSTMTPFKIAYSEDPDTVTALYPAGEDDYYIPRYNSRWFTVEFAPDGSFLRESYYDAWYDGYVVAYPCEPPEDGSSDSVPVPYRDYKINQFEDAFLQQFPYCIDDAYNELYVHSTDDTADWALVQVIPEYGNEGASYGVFDDVVLFGSEFYPFDFGYGVYDVKMDTFYSITEAWNRGYSDLHDVFLNTIKTKEYYHTLGDVDFDRELTVIDVTMIQRSLVNLCDLENCESPFEHSSPAFGKRMKSLADYDADGEVDIVDATWIQRTLVGRPLYPHSFTVSLELTKDGSTVTAKATSSYGSEPVQYCFILHGGLHAYSVYGNDMGDFHDLAEDDEMDVEWTPGDYYFTTGYIDSDTATIPLTSLTYDDDFDVWVIAKDARGNTTQKAVRSFWNVYSQVDWDE